MNGINDNSSVLLEEGVSSFAKKYQKKKQPFFSFMHHDSKVAKDSHWLIYSSLRSAWTAVSELGLARSAAELGKSSVPGKKEKKKGREKMQLVVKRKEKCNWVIVSSSDAF